RFWASNLSGSDPNRSIVVADINSVGYHPYVGVNDVMATLCRPSIGISADTSLLFAAFSVPSDITGGLSTPTSYMDIWFTYSSSGGAAWQQPEKITPVSPVKDWRYVSIAPWNDKVGSNYYCNMVALKGHIPGSYINGYENGESAEEYWFMRALVTPGPTPPISPALLSPANNSSWISLTPLLDWSDVSGVTSYNLQVSTNSQFTSTIINLSNLTTSQYQVSSGLLQINTTYYWRVSSTNGNGTGQWSVVWSFTTLGVPPAPALVSPENGTIVNTVTPLLNWSDVPEATSYGVQVALNPSFSAIILNITNIPISQYQITSPVLPTNLFLYWRANASNSYGTGNWSPGWYFTIILTGISTYSDEIPAEFRLFENFPNPFNPETKIKFDIPVSSEVEIIIFDISGRKVSELVNSKLNPGKYEVRWSGENLASGVYFYKIKTNSFTDTKRMILLK
ncbi:MAG: T9SS type A sorting domain-containing protein, partial [Ignavibacteria bacterium]|nr:T9SS type A sorting domain-containing protein [Ignavibacteria bacterium]